ncbi:nuclear transport factor 2 family protein [Nocardiopsis lucentensis]|uniref:nuclear transport factor 2 family protein n=1 Tax=Nocardiopsis lucentensis TaxID=53441 RepID=UPI00034B79C1|nr:nuclear transport factor 2 family protein [Nocardiopsis lucentensis]
MSAAAETARPFDAELLKRAVEARDADTFLAQFSDDAELEMFDQHTPPSAPTVLHGRDAIGATMRELFARDMRHEVLQCVVEGDHAAYTERCSYPDGSKVMSMTMLDLRDGRIVHQATVQAFDEEHATGIEVGDFTAPAESEEAELSRADVVRVGGMAVVRLTLEPGWRWSKDVGPALGTDLCMLDHCGYIVSGSLCVRMADGSERLLHAGEIARIPPGHDGWVVGDEQAIIVDWKARN